MIHVWCVTALHDKPAPIERKMVFRSQSIHGEGEAGGVASNCNSACLHLQNPIATKTNGMSAAQYACAMYPRPSSLEIAGPTQGSCISENKAQSQSVSAAKGNTRNAR